MWIWPFPMPNIGKETLRTIADAKPSAKYILPSWPKCHVCAHPVGHYDAEQTDGIVTVRAECHGKVNVESFPSDCPLPLVMFRPGYDGIPQKQKS